MKLSASILSIQHDIDIKEKIFKLLNCPIDYLHLDIMDGNFVVNKTWEYSDILKLLPKDAKNLDVHLMVNDVKNYISQFSLLKPLYITFQLEAVNNPLEIINLIKEQDIRVGIALKPNTPISSLKDYFALIDLILVMSVEPGLGGQSFLDNSAQKIDELYDIRESNNYRYVIEVDGGINDKSIDHCRKADIVVVGSFITNGSYEERIEKLKIK
ncbi:MAG: ribulose-phosphate 3-epimerase [Bacilli bacterium]|nr:ribulose-phosphate 3-epimerase [Bacilli bacterium]